ncbi:MAG: hypothetical protein WAO21_02020, partial [Verrucomicrobiia bacterium]
VRRQRENLLNESYYFHIFLALKAAHVNSHRPEFLKHLPVRLFPIDVHVAENLVIIVFKRLQS